MKKILIIILFFNLHQISATNTPLFEIKKSLIQFLVETEYNGNNNVIKDIHDSLILDLRTDENIKEGKNGIFLFKMLSFHQYQHFLLINDDTFTIINMRNSLDENIKILSGFLKQNDEYNKADTLFYIDTLVRIHLLNQKKLKNETN